MQAKNGVDGVTARHSGRKRGSGLGQHRSCQIVGTTEQASDLLLCMFDQARRDGCVIAQRWLGGEAEIDVDRTSLAPRLTQTTGMTRPSMKKQCRSCRSKQIVRS